jgi:hypothetical protein
MSRITPPTELKILEEFIADLWKISPWVSVGDNSPGVDSLGPMCGEVSKVSTRWRRAEVARREHGVGVKAAGGW